MTLLANDLPKVGEFKAMPTWGDLAELYSGRVTGLILSFIIAGVFWISHHRRLARQPEAGRHIVLLNLVFLLSIMLLPVTNGLYGNYRMSSAVAVIFGPAPHRHRRAECHAVVAGDARLPPPADRSPVSAGRVPAGDGGGGIRPAICVLFLVPGLWRPSDPSPHGCGDGRQSMTGFTPWSLSRRTHRPARKA
jgi:hypothetical protein